MYETGNKIGDSQRRWRLWRLKAWTRSPRRPSAPPLRRNWGPSREVRESQVKSKIKVKDLGNEAGSEKAASVSPVCERKEGDEK